MCPTNKSSKLLPNFFTSLEIALTGAVRNEQQCKITFRCSCNLDTYSYFLSSFALTYRFCILYTSYSLNNFSETIVVCHFHQFYEPITQFLLALYEENSNMMYCMHTVGVVLSAIHFCKYEERFSISNLLRFE